MSFPIIILLVVLAIMAIYMYFSPFQIDKSTQNFLNRSREINVALLSLQRLRAQRVNFYKRYELIGLKETGEISSLQIGEVIKQSEIRCDQLFEKLGRI